MAFDVLHHCTFLGPALPEPFVQFELERELQRLGLLPRTVGAEGEKLQQGWESYRRRLRELAGSGGSLRVRNQVVEPLVERLGYGRLEAVPEVETREGREPGGTLLVTADGTKKLRVWTAAFQEDLDAPARRGSAYRYSHARIAERVLLAAGERVGLLTNGVELRLLLCDPARPGSHVVIPLDPHWRRSRDVPDSYRLVLALASPQGVAAVPELVEKARLQQTRVTKDLRVQAREAIERFVQEVLDHPANHEQLQAHTDKARLARDLWHEALKLVYRLLFLLKLEATDDPARAFNFASSSLWRNTFSPSVALAEYAKAVLGRGEETGTVLEDGLRALFRMFTGGLACTELHVKPLGGALFGPEATPLLTGLRWGERAVAHLLDRLLWTPKRRGSEARQRVHYGPLDVKDLGRVYEALLELEPGIAAEPMCRLRRQKLEVVVPVAQGEKYGGQGAGVRGQGDEGIGSQESGIGVDFPDPESRILNPDEEEDADEEEAGGGKKTKVEWKGRIEPGSFYLRVGLGRKASGSYYTPDSFVRFLVQETLGPLCAERSPRDDPRPAELLQLKVLDPAMGSGHFQVETCRFLGEKLYEACRLCDEKALAAEARAEKAKTAEDRQSALAEAAEYRRRVVDLPDPDDELVRYLPSRAPEGEESGLSQKKAEALCKRLVAVHCLYGVDKNPLAVELAKLALWIETQAEGLPLTFLDHRFLVGDSLTGPFFEHLLKYPGSQKPFRDLFTQGLQEKFTAALQDALVHVRELEATVGASLGEIEAKVAAKARLDRALAPFKVVAAAWAGGVMLGEEACDDDGYGRLLKVVAETADLPEDLTADEGLRRMIARGLGVDAAPGQGAELLAVVADGAGSPAHSYELAFPEVFFPTGRLAERSGFHVVLGNPPWDTVRKNEDQFFGAVDFAFLVPPTKREKAAIRERLLRLPVVAAGFQRLVDGLEERDRINDALFTSHKARVHGQLAGRGTYDDYMLFAEKAASLLAPSGLVGFVLPSAFHANEGATGLRRLYLNDMGLRVCYSFENRRKLFEIDSRFKFAPIVATRQGPTSAFACGFYLHDDEWLFGARGDERALSYSRDFVRATGGDYLSFLELRSSTDQKVAEACYARGKTFGAVCEDLSIALGQEVNMTYDGDRFVSTAEVVPAGADPRDPPVTEELTSSGYLVLHEGKTFHQFDDHWEARPRYLVPVVKTQDRPAFAEAAAYYRAAFRDIARSNDERTVIFGLVPPGALFGNTAPAERNPSARPNSASLLLVGLANSYVFDWMIRIKAAAHVNFFILNGGVLPPTDRIRLFVTHAALRLTCNHEGYKALWRDQMGEIWREPTRAAWHWPTVEGAGARWQVRSEIDAVVADAYGLTRDQYAHVLSTFSHTSHPKAPELCLSKFDELKAIGLEAFTKKYDPYWDIPLNEKLPKPVIELPVTEETGASNQESKGRKSEKRKAAMLGTLNAEFRIQTPSPFQLSFLSESSGDALSLPKLGSACNRQYLQPLGQNELIMREKQRREVRHRKRS